MDDRRILDLYFARSEEAIRHTKDKYGRLLFGISYNIVKSDGDAEECVSDTYLHTWRSIPPKQPSVLRTFLGKLTRNLSIDRLRSMKRAKRSNDLTVSFEEIGDILAATEDTSEGELTELLNSFLDSLPDTECRLFVGRYWYGYSVSKMAAGYGMSANAVSKQLARTREGLRVYLNERGYEV